MYQPKSGISFWGDGGGRGPKIKVAQNGLKHILVLEFLKSNEICKVGKNFCKCS